MEHKLAYQIVDHIIDMCNRHNLNTKQKSLVYIYIVNWINEMIATLYDHTQDDIYEPKEE
ncbi:MAG: hypothetical protein AB1744_00890 [Candidatus Zixiibacteriota bacterium]